MPRFVFKLRGVLRQRRREEQERQRELAARQAQLVELHNALKLLHETVQRTNEDVRRNHLIGRLDMGFLAAHRRFLGAMQRQAITLAQRMALAQRAVDDARSLLAEAAKRRKAIEKLQQRHFERWLADENRRENAEIDEIGMQLAYRNLTEEAQPTA